MKRSTILFFLFFFMRIESAQKNQLEFNCLKTTDDGSILNYVHFIMLKTE